MAKGKRLALASGPKRFARRCPRVLSSTKAASSNAYEHSQREGLQGLR